jgi:hypothetical protein
MGSVVGGDQFESLRSWRAQGPAALEAASARLARHPNLPDAARALAVNMLAAGDKDKALRGIFKDAGRYIVAMLAIYLHLGGGLTLTRLKDFCAMSRLVSPGRARALLLYLRYLGYVELFPVHGPGKAARYMPTAHFLASWNLHLKAALDAIAHIEPAAAVLRDRLDEPAVFDAFARLQADGLRETSSGGYEMDTAYFRVFLHRHAGSQIIFLLLATNETFPPQGATPFSLAAASRRFGVSRIHIRRLLDAAEAEGLLRNDGEGNLTLEEAGRAEIEKSYRHQIAHLLAAAAAAVDEAADVVSTTSDARPRVAHASAEMRLM